MNAYEINNLKKEYQHLIDTYGERIVSSFFTSGFDGFKDSRIRGNYSLDAIKQNLNHLL